MASTDDQSEAARAAVAVGDWNTARLLFEQMLAVAAEPDTLFGLGDVLWWQGRTDEAISYQEQAYAGFRRRGDPAQSTMTAVALYLTCRVSLGNVAMARGWLARAARLVQEAGLAPLAGWVTLLRAHDSEDPGAAERWSREARQAAAGFGDPDLELCAISQLGAALVQQGRPDEGTVLLDEAMAASLAGECRRPHTVVYTSCNMISACAETAEVDHALQWIRAAEGFTDRYGSPHLYLHCRIYYGAILFASGDWAAAERELSAALSGGASAEPALYAEAAARLAELRLAQGHLEQAERIMDGLHDYATSAYALAAIGLTRGDHGAARRIALRRIRELEGRHDEDDGQGGDRRRGSYHAGLAGMLEAGRLWELVAEVSAGPEAGTALARLTELGAQTRCAQLEARALRAAGAANRDVTRLEQALSLFVRMRLPFEAARTRLGLARLLDSDSAIAEARASLSTFEALGAAREADRAAGLLRDLGVTVARGGPAGLGELTHREHEVLGLLAEGLSNRELAERLFLSRKTVERHVRNVLLKLGLRNRTEAAAYVLRREPGALSGR